MKLSEEQVKKIVDYFSQKPEITVVYLYGSYARGEADGESDIDLGVVFKEKPEAAFNLPEVTLAEDLSNLIGKDVEVQDLAICSIDFAHRVISEGQLIFCTDEIDRAEVEEKIIRDYFDIKPLLSEYYRCLSEIAKKGELGVRYIKD